MPTLSDSFYFSILNRNQSTSLYFRNHCQGDDYSLTPGKEKWALQHLTSRGGVSTLISCQIAVGILCRHYSKLIMQNNWKVAETPRRILQVLARIGLIDIV